MIKFYKVIKITGLCYLALLGFACTSTPDKKNNSSEAISTSNNTNLEELIPITMANLRGHKSLYKEGWFVVSSTDKALQYAYRKSVESSGKALLRLQHHIVEHSVKMADAVVEGVKRTGQKTSSSFRKGSKNSNSILGVTHIVAKVEGAIANEAAISAWRRFITGYIDLVPHTKESLQPLKHLPKKYWSEMKSDFSKLHTVSDTYLNHQGPALGEVWLDALTKAQHSFMQEYEASGQQSNTIVALGNILKGYAKSSYHAVLAPSVTAAKRGGKLATKGVAYPLAAGMIISGRTIQSLGRMLYFTGKTGISIISPTVEGGLLAGLAVLSYGVVPITYLTGGGIGIMNQVVVTVKAPIEGAGSGILHTGTQVFYHTALLSYDLVTSGANVTINYISSGVALGYNALTALPTQVLLGSVNAVFFLAWDGPRLVVARVKSTRNEPEFGQLPVGSVVDLQKLKEQEDMQLEIVTQNPEIINKVLEKIPSDMRETEL